MPTAEAERLLGRHLRVGCEPNIYLSSSKATLTVAFSGRTRSGGHVFAFVLHGLQDDPGVFECM